MVALKPWEIHPQLTDARLRVIGLIIRDTRRQAVDSVYDARRGDSGWGVGCVVYERTCFALSTAAGTKPYSDWLSVVEQDGLKFSFAVGGVPLRFYRGVPDRSAPGRTLRVRAPELEAQQLSFLDAEEDEANLICRLVIEVEDTGYVSRVAFARVDRDGALRDVWVIPHEGEAVVLPFDGAVPPVDVEPPVVRPTREERAQAMPKEERRKA